MKESPGEMYALAAVLTVLASVAVVLRCYARKIKKQTLSWDDYVIVVALLFTMSTAVCMFVGTAIGDLGRHTKIGPDGMPIVDHRTVVFMQISYASLMTTTLTFGLTKLSVLLFYKRIFRGEIIIKAIWTMISVVIVWTVAFFFANMLQCIPLSLNWTGLGGNNFQCIDENMMYLGQAFSDVITDVMILSMPLPCIWALQMSKKCKVAICGVFLLGALTVAASVTRLVFTYKIAAATLTGDMDLTYLLTPIVYWPMVESSLGIVGACLPSMRPVFTEGFLSGLRSILSPSSIWERSRNGSKQSPNLIEDLESNRSDSSMEELRSKMKGSKVPKVSQRPYSLYDSTL